MPTCQSKIRKFSLMVGLLISGCNWIGDAPLPEVNDENCKYENVMKLHDKAARQEFSSMFFRRSKFERSPPKGW